MRKGQISISPRGGNFQFSAGGERCMYLKKKFTPRFVHATASKQKHSLQESNKNTKYVLTI